MMFDKYKTGHILENISLFKVETHGTPFETLKPISALIGGREKKLESKLSSVFNYKKSCIPLHVGALFQWVGSSCIHVPMLWQHIHACPNGLGVGVSMGCGPRKTEADPIKLG